MVLLEHLILCLSSNQSEKDVDVDSRMAVTQSYIRHKVQQIETKLGLKLGEQVVKLSHNYALNYIHNLASERVSTIFNSFRHSLQLLVNMTIIEKESTLNSDYVSTTYI